MALLDPLDYLDALKVSLEGSGVDADTLNVIAQLKDDYGKKYWHEVSEGVVKALTSSHVRAVAFDLHKHVALPIRLEISMTNYTTILFITVQSMVSGEAGGDATENMNQAEELLNSATSAMVASGGKQALRCVQCIRSILMMVAGPSLEGKRLLDDASDYLATLQPHEVEPIFQALLTKAKCRLHELSGDFSAFYETVFLMISYAERCGLAISQAEYAAIGYKTALAALLSNSVYTFGQLLSCDSLVDTLQASSDNWLLNLVRLCNAGDAAGLEACLTTNASLVAASPEITNALPHLKKKVRLMALLHLVFHTKADARRFSFATLAERCSVPVDEVELLLLSALALHLIEGRVDGLSSTVEITWLQPRVVERDDIRALAARVREWRLVAKETFQNVEKMAAEVPN